MTFDVDALVVAAFLAFCRIGSCFMVMPGLSSVRVPVQIRLFVAVAASFALLMHLWDSLLPIADSQPAVLAGLVLSEVATGALIGLMARIYILALQFVGAAMAMMMGYGALVTPSIEEADAQPPLTNLITFGALLLLFIGNFHHEIIKALVASYRIAPPNLLFNPRSALTDVTDTLSESFLVMIQLGSPFIAYGIIVNLIVGFLNKLTPQIPIYFVSLPFVLAGGLVLVYFGLGGMLRLFADGFVPITIGR
ncbi:flagellar biosynthetic protein FliR [Mesorhizobium xinjiangense]|uniref:flagellar biosynthetic protein FliR n=1 Tax=Mesorhizobium xinjiangense TaxID=2678685 RepID=UPI0012ED8B55|nr:flagellar biosynthetic protein FliR [Mesorhizobium xinjiangense]